MPVIFVTFDFVSWDNGVTYPHLFAQVKTKTWGAQAGKM
jgi:hypothetical protein